MSPGLGFTPILDRIQSPPVPKAARKRARAYPTIIGGLIGGAFAILLASAGKLDSPFELLLFILCFQLAVAVHEAGHLIAGALMGFLCRGAMVCCYRVVKTARGWRFSFEWKRIVSGGFAYVFPSSLDLKDWQYAVMVAAGPGASILLLALVVFLPWPKTLDAAQGPALLAAGILAVCALLPLNSGIVVSDMGRLITFMRGGDGWKRWRLMLGFSTLNVQCVPTREWDQKALEEAVSLPGGRAADRLHAILLAYWAASGRREFAEAARFLEAALTISHQIGPVGRNIIFLSAAEFQAHCRKDAAGGRAWLTEAGTARNVPKECLASAQAAVLLAEGHFAEAAKKASYALARLKRKTIDAATTQQGIDSLDEFLDEASAGMNAPLTKAVEVT